MINFNSDFLNSSLNIFNIDKEIYEFNNVYVCPKTGIVFDKNIDPIVETLHDYITWNPSYITKGGALNLAEQATLRLPLINTIKEKIFKDVNSNNILHLGNKISAVHLLSPFGWYPYGHIHDYLQKVFIVEKYRLKFQILLHSRSVKVNDFNQHLHALDIKEGSLFECHHDFPPIHAEKLYFLMPFIPTKLTEETSLFLYNKYNKYFSKLYFKYLSLPKKNIFLDRNHVRQGNRQVLNYDDVVKYCNKNNFDIIYGTEPLSYIVKAFSQAKFIFGAHGALFSNIIFCQPKCNILEFCPDKRVVKQFPEKFKVCNNYTWQAAKSDDNYNIDIDLSYVNKFLY